MNITRESLLERFQLLSDEELVGLFQSGDLIDLANISRLQLRNCSGAASKSQCLRPRRIRRARMRWAAKIMLPQVTSW